jgi:hypothetical protein
MQLAVLQRDSTSQTWSWSTDGVNFFTDLGTVTGTVSQSGFGLVELNTLSFLDNISTAYLRVTLDWSHRFHWQ